MNTFRKCCTTFTWNKPILHAHNVKCHQICKVPSELTNEREREKENETENSEQQAAYKTFSLFTRYCSLFCCHSALSLDTGYIVNRKTVATLSKLLPINLYLENDKENVCICV